MTYTKEDIKVGFRFKHVNGDIIHTVKSISEKSISLSCNDGKDCMQYPLATAIRCLNNSTWVEVKDEKPAIPTDEEIDVKADIAAYEKYGALPKKQEFQRKVAYYTGHMAGYKQALKDLGLKS